MVHRSLWSFGIIIAILFISTSSLLGFVHGLDNLSGTSRDFHTDIELYNNTKKSERRIFGYRKNGVRLDIRLVSGVNESNSEEDDRFPMPPIRDLGHCVMDLSTVCIKNRISRYIDVVSRLDKITLFGSTIKFIKVRELPKAVVSNRAMDSIGNIDRSIDDFFDKFALRITLPGWNKRKEQNQIDFMFDDRDVVEGRAKGGGGGGKGGKGGGGKCKQMMMCMMMALKMKMAGMMGLMMVKGMMMAAVSMMMTKAMLLMKLMKLKGSGGGGGGGGGHQSGGQLKEIVLLTKASSSGGHGSSHGSPPPTSYGAPPTSAGSGGYGGGGGGGGWGRSFENRIPMKTSVEEYSISDNPQQIGDFSIVNTYPELYRSNYLRSIDNHENIGEVYQPIEVESVEKYSQMDNENNEKMIDIKNQLGNKYNNTHIVYANYWKNYETANKLWDTNSPIVATKTLSTENIN